MMNTSLKSDDFYVKHPSKGDYFSLAGLQFLSELVSLAVKEVGWDPTKVSFGCATDVSVWVGYPSASTKIIKDLRVENDKLHIETRLDKEGKLNWWHVEKLPMAHPELAKQLGEIMVKNLPKTSKFAK